MKLDEVKKLMIEQFEIVEARAQQFLNAGWTIDHVNMNFSESDPIDGEAKSICICCDYGLRDGEDEDVYFSLGRRYKA